MRDVAIGLGERHRQEFRRFALLSLALHLVVGVALLISPSGPQIAPPLGVRVRLVAAPPAATPPKPVAKPAPARPRPKPKPPKPAPVVLPTQPTTPKPERKPEPKPPEPVPEVPPQEEGYVDVLEQLRAELGEEAPPEAPPTQVAATGPIGTPDGAPVSAEVAAWLRAARAHVRRNWAVPPAFEMLSLVTTISVDLDAAGNVRGQPSVESRSGNPWYDENVVRSIQKASPIPAPPKAGRWTFVFRSDRD
ncbi:MAG: TonB C-terminal domain-containing protein [Deltaproteobacteria bacterium]|nr:TonB C-terminal domain-containing protein [Deltaproteobacteria bacterium]